MLLLFIDHNIDLTVDPTSTSLTLTNTTMEPVCWDVAAKDDNVFENSENFSMTFTLTDGVSVGQQGTATITVTDNDGETL